MGNTASIKVGEIKGYSWVSINGRGDVFTAPKVKEFTEGIFEKLSQNRAAKFVFDMEDCTGMDSTFMGMIAGLAIKLQGVANSCLQLCGVSSANQESLEELGIDSLVDINPTGSEWNNQYQEIRSELSEWNPEGKHAPKSDLILDSHKILGSLNKENEEEFSEVIKSFESEQDQ